MHVFQDINGSRTQRLVHIEMNLSQLFWLILITSIYTLEVGDELKEIIADCVGVGLEPFLLFGLLLHILDEGADLLHYC